MYVERSLSGVLDTAMRQFPVVFVTGPRQSGKTTFVRHHLPDAAYVSFDDPLQRELAREDPTGLLDRLGDGPVIFDEVQYVPSLLQHLKLRIDRDRGVMGRWVLTGSQRFQLMDQITESLAGRVAILELLPFSLRELASAPVDTSLESIVWNGLYPQPALHPDSRTLWLSSYIQTYIERDVRSIQRIPDLRAFETFISVCAARHSQELGYAALSRQTGVSQPTGKAWVGVLEAAHIVSVIPPYFENFGKRAIKSPKMYFLDPAIACALTRQPSAEAALAGAMGGALFEGLIVGEMVKAQAESGSRADLYHWRSHDGLEVDAVLPSRDGLVPIEIKLTASPRAAHFAPIERFKKLAGDKATGEGVLVCRVDETVPMPNGNVALPWHELPKWIRQRL